MARRVRLYIARRLYIYIYILEIIFKRNDKDSALHRVNAGAKAVTDDDNMEIRGLVYVRLS